MSRVGRACLAVGTAAVAAVLLVTASGGGVEGTVVAKNGPAPVGYACRAGGLVSGPIAIPVWGACSGPCWRLEVRAGDGTVSEACVSRADYDRTQPGTFWHGRTDGS